MLQESGVDISLLKEPRIRDGDGEFYIRYDCGDEVRISKITFDLKTLNFNNAILAAWTGRKIKHIGDDGSVLGTS